jgi:uncharacterized protein
MALNMPQELNVKGGEWMDELLKKLQAAEKLQKSFTVTGLEVKESEQEKGVIEGYASTFGNLDRHGDIIAPGTFKGGRSKVPIFGLHRADLAVGVGFVSEDEKGLKIKMKLAVNAESDILRERAKEYYSMVKEGIIEKMSVGMIILEREWVERAIDGKKIPVRMIKKADLVEVSLVPIPANDKATVTSVKEHDAEDLERLVEAAVQKALQQKEEKHIEEVVKKFNRDALVASRLGLF